MIRRFVFFPAHRWWVGLAVVVVLMALLLGRADLAPMGRSFLHADWRWAAAAVALLLVSLVLRSAALKVIVDALGDVRAHLSDTFSATSIGLLANFLIPVRVDVVLSPYVLFILLRRRRASVPFATALGTTLTEQLFAIATFVALALLFVSTLSVPSWAVEVLIASAAFAATFLAGGIILERRRQRAGPQAIASGGVDDRWGAEKAVERAGATPVGRGHRRYLHELIDSQRIMGRPVSALLVVGIQTLAWLIQLAAAVAALEAFHVTAAGLRGAALVLVLTNLIGLIPITPGNLGTFQAAAVAALAVYGVSGGPAIAYALGLQGLQLVVAVVAGLVSLSLQDLTLAELRAQGQQAASLLRRGERGAPSKAE